MYGKVLVVWFWHIPVLLVVDPEIIKVKRNCLYRFNTINSTQDLITFALMSI